MRDIVCEIQPYRRKKYRKISVKHRLLIIAVVLSFVVVAVFLHLHFNVDPIVQRVSEYKIKAQVSEIVNTSAAEIFTGSYEYSDFTDVQRNSDGEIILIQTDVVLINLIARSFVLKVQQSLNDVLIDGVDVPIGAFSGIAVLAGAGSGVRVKTVAMGAAAYEYESVFESAGINQTLHRLLINVRTDVEILLPGGRSTVRTSTSVAAAESIIIGKVPQFYLNK